MTQRTTSRREFLTTAAGAAAFGFLASPYLGSRAYGSTATPKFNVLETRSFSFPNDSYFGWPTVAKLGKELFVVTSGHREGHICPFGRVDMFRSHDDGATWTYPETICDSPIDDRDAGICATAKGSLLVTTFTSLAYEPGYLAEKKLREEGQGKWSDERFALWTSAHERVSDEQRKSEVGQWMFRSTDGGVTWSKRYSTPFNSPHGPVQLSDGRLLYVGKELWTTERRCGACVSEDDGQTWRVSGIIGAREGDSVVQYHELHAVEASDGRIVAHIRNENPNNFCENLQTISKDGGETWSTPTTIGVWGIPSFLMKLADGRLLMTYGHRRAPLGIQARTSDDCGETWSDPMVIYGDAKSGDLGYPSTVQLDDGSLLTVWYEVHDAPQSRLRLCRWTIS